MDFTDKISLSPPNMMLKQPHRNTVYWLGLCVTASAFYACPPGQNTSDSGRDTGAQDTGSDTPTDQAQDQGTDTTPDLSVVDEGVDTGPADAVEDTTITMDVTDAQDIVAIDIVDAEDIADVQDVPDVQNDVPVDVVDDVLPNNCTFLQPGPAHGPDDGTYCSIGQDVPGAVIPSGFCMRRYGQINHARMLALAPNGDVFVTAPQATSAGRNPDDAQPAAPPGPGAIIVLSDDNRDGVAEQTTFANNVFDVHGIVIGGGYVWFTTQNGVYRSPYTSGQRQETPNTRELFSPYPGGAPFPMPGFSRWTHGIARSVTGQIYTSIGVWGASCPDPNVGHLLRADMNAMTSIANGFRNPMYMRCHFMDDVCFAAELGDDGGGAYGAREKMVLLRDRGAYGFPCCSTTNVMGVPPFGGGDAGPTDCSSVTTEEGSFPLNDTPFGFDWERGSWPTQYRGAMFVALHGSYYTFPRWGGARVVYAPTDPVTHIPTGNWQTFIGGFGPCESPLQRPADVVFAPDGRMFLADDQGNTVYFVAPVGLRRQ